MSHTLDSGATWTPQTVAKLFEVGPMAYIPGTKMPEQLIGSAADRAALVAPVAALAVAARAAALDGAAGLAT